MISRNFCTRKSLTQPPSAVQYFFMGNITHITSKPSLDYESTQMYTKFHQISTTYEKRNNDDTKDKESNGNNEGFTDRF